MYVYEREVKRSCRCVLVGCKIASTSLSSMQGISQYRLPQRDKNKM